MQGLSGREATAAGPESADDLGEKESAFTYGNQSRCKKDSQLEAQSVAEK